MLDYEDGPSRRVSQGRKRVSTSASLKGITSPRKPAGKAVTKSKVCSPPNDISTNGLPSKVSPLKQSDWFCNSFGSRSSRYNTRKTTSLEREANPAPLSSTPKSRQPERESTDLNSLNSSDALFAEIDMENVSSYANNQSDPSLQHSTNQTSCNSSRTSQSDNRVQNLNGDNQFNRMSGKSGKQNERDTLDHLNGQVLPDSTNNVTLQLSVSESQSQYFPSKFANYKPSQARQNDATKEIIVENKITQCHGKNNTPFSFSYVGCDTQFENCDKTVNNTNTVVGIDGNEMMEENSQIISQRACKNDGTKRYNTRRSSDDKFSVTQVNSVCDNSEIQNSTEWDNKEIVSSTQFCITQVNPEVNGTQFKYRCTPFNSKVTLLADETRSQLVNMSCLDSQIQNAVTTDINTTLLKDSCAGNEFKYRCTPYKAEVKDICTRTQTQSETQSELVSDTQYKSYLSENVDTTQLKGSCDKGQFRYRCTPYKSKLEDTCTQSQSTLVSDTQFKSYLHERHTQGDHLKNTQGNGKGQSQLLSTQFKGTPYGDSQIQATGLCDMTGLIVDSQNVDKAANTSDCDMFGDSFHDPDLLTQVDKLDREHSQSNREGYGGKNDKEIEFTSHTQSLVCENKTVPKNNKTKKRSLDDDLETISQESQKRRSLARNSNRSVNYEGDKRSGDKIVHSKGDSKMASINKLKSIEGETGFNSNHTLNQKGDCVSHIHINAVSFGSKAKCGTEATAITLLGTNLPVTPGGAGTLQERIKQRLKQNAGQRTPKGPGSLVDQLREQVLERVHLEAEMMKEVTKNDIGPFYGLPSKVKHLFERDRGIKTLYDWQDECLKLPAVINRKNLIYSLPTSGGKTLVAEILILQELLCHKRDALLILPFVSIVQEKVRNMSQFAVDLDFHVEEYAGSKGRFPPIKRRKSHSLYVATIEKAQSIVNSLIEGERMDGLGLVVVDELHMIGEGGSRGATLESTMLKILHSSSPTQIIGMSATLNNIDDLRQFLNAEVYSNDFRPVQLTENIKLSDNIYRIDGKSKCSDDQFLHERVVCFQYLPEMEKVDPDHLLGLALEVIPDNSCLVFCPTKKNCENVALMLCKLIVKYKRELSNVRKKERKDLLKELFNDSEGKICPVLQYTIHFGVAYHHSGLTVDERRLIEDAYSNGTLCLLACTSTLAAGVNLPAKRVILRSPYVGQYFISRSQYKQMVGRAGRAGIDSSGESILICKATDREKVCELLGGPLESCHSSLTYDGGKGLRTLILSTVGLKITTSTEDVFQFMSRSLATIQQQSLGMDVSTICKESLQKLIDLGLVLQTKSQSEDPADNNVVHSLEVTELGKATFKGPIDCDYAGMLYRDLKKAEEPLVISTHLHLLYLVTPYDMAKDVAPSWFIYFNQMNTLTSSELRVASLIGVPESYIARRASQQKSKQLKVVSLVRVLEVYITKRASKQKIDEFVVSRFYLTLMLYDLWRQKSVWDVAEKFQQPRGFIQSLLSSAASFASCVAHFCQEMEEFWAYQDLMGNFVKRLAYCVSAELIPLMEIPGVKLGRARLMYTAGYKTLSSVANVDPDILVKAVQYLPRKVAKQIVASAKLLLNEKAEAMMQEVEQLVSIPEGIAVPVTVAAIATPAPITPGFSQSSADSQLATV